MTSYNLNKRPMSISTINIDVDDIETPRRENYRYRHNFEDTISSTSTKINTRSCFIILILVLIIITLLSLAGLIIAIYSLALSTKNTGIITIAPIIYSETTANVTTTTNPVICSSSPSTSYEYATATPSQCLNYTNNIDETRNVAYTRSINLCDNVSPFNNVTSVWIRFKSPAGTVVANSPVPPNFCGTVATGWYAGQYPISVFSTATSIVCYYYTTNTCTDCNLISITNCKTFYVFLLRQPQFCNYRYCTL